MLSSYIDNDNDDNDNKNPAKAARIISNLNHKNTKLYIFPPKILYCIWSFYLKFMSSSH